MRHSESITKISESLVAAQKEIKVAKFDSKNPYYKSKYASLGAVIEASREALAKNGLTVIQFPVTDEHGSVGVETTLLHSSGEWLSETVTVPLDFEAKNLAQEAGKNITYLRRYSLASLLNMYADEDVDGNDTEQQAESKPEKPKTAKEPRPASRTPLKPDKVVANLIKRSESVPKATDEEMQLLAITLSEFMNRDDNLRHKVQTYLFGKESLIEADRTMVTAAIQWLKPYQDEDGNYKVERVASVELADVVAYAMEAESEE